MHIGPELSPCRPSAAHRPHFPHRAFLATALLALSLLVLLGAAAPAAADVAKDFQSAWNEFHSLNKDQRRGSYRSNWLAVERRFQKIYQESPTGAYAPKALYYLGRTYEELGARSGLRTDFERAADYYQRVVARFPKHTWSDDCLLRKADIELTRLGRPDEAYADLLLIVHNYPKGDMHDEARDLLRTMDAGAAAAAAPGTPAIKPVNPPVASPPPGDDTPNLTAMAVLERVRFKSSDDYTRVVLDLNDEAKFSWQLLNPHKTAGLPQRVYVDLKNTRLSPDVTESMDIADGILNRIRTGQHDRETARVVLDLDALQDYKVFNLYDPYRVVIDIFAADKTPPRAVAARSSGTPNTPDPASRKLAGDLVEQLGLTVNTIMIDAGHGGKDPGAMSNGLREKDIVLKIAKKVGAKLKAKGFNVIYTRGDDTFIPLEERTALANVKRADMFVSIHCNAHKNSAISGIETYTLNLAKSQDAVRVAARENAVTTKRISDLQVILTDLMLNSKIKESHDLASEVQKGTLVNVRKSYNLKDRNVREAPFYVLMGAKMPSILVEVGYITNPTEAKRLRSENYQNQVADGIVAGIVAYKQQIERYASL